MAGIGTQVTDVACFGLRAARHEVQLPCGLNSRSEYTSTVCFKVDAVISAPDPAHTHS